MPFLAPPAAIVAIGAASNNAQKGTWTAYDSVNKLWVGVIVTHTLLPFPHMSYSYKYYDTNNTQKRSGSLGTDTASLTLIRWSDGKIYKKAKDLLGAAAAGTAPLTSIDGAQVPINDTPLSPTGADRWNPPNHFSTRTLPFSKNLNQQASETLQAATKYSSNLGKIYQNVDSAKSLNTKSSKTSAPPAISNKTAASSLWGFRFTYNPTSIRYGTTIDTSIDWMLAPKDPSAFFGGNTTVSFDLYLNRIADMSTLLNNKQSEAYTSLSAEHKNGILKRGTEYDLEYLYRVVNGDPGKTSLVSDSTLLTSDYGYITGMPLWIQLHDNLIYKGSLSSLSVEHVIFTENMVPTLSVVSLSFIRYPELAKGNATANQIKSIHEKALEAKTTIK